MERLPYLHVVEISDCQGVTDASVELLAGLPRLRTVRVDDCRVSAAAMDRLRRALPACRVMHDER